MSGTLETTEGMESTAIICTRREQALVVNSSRERKFYAQGNPCFREVLSELREGQPSDAAEDRRLSYVLRECMGGYDTSCPHYKPKTNGQ